MFEKFGEMDSAEELNKAAEGFKQEGDMESLMALVTENGIDEDDARDYIDGETDSLATDLSAALGRLSLQEAEDAPEELRRYIATARVMAVSSPEIREGLMRKGKRLKEIYDTALKVAQKKAAELHQKTRKPVAARGFESDVQVKRLIRTYLTMDKKKFEQYVNDGTEVHTV